MNDGIRVVYLRGVGDQFVTEQYKTDDGTVMFRQPLSMVPVQNPETGQTQIALQPWFAMAEFDRKEGIHIDDSEILFNYPAVSDLKNAYNATLNPVQTVSSSALPENKFGVAAEEMTGGGLRITE